MQLQNYKPLKNGYTIIELLVGITIISIVFSVGFASYREFSRRQALSGVSKTIKSDLRLAQQLASSGQKPETGTCTTLSGHTLTFSTNSYSLDANCSDGNINIKTVNLPTGITQTNNKSVQYKVLGQGTDLSADITLILSYTATGDTVDITIGQGGEVK